MEEKLQQERHKIYNWLSKEGFELNEKQTAYFSGMLQEYVKKHNQVLVKLNNEKDLKLGNLRKEIRLNHRITKYE